MRAPEYQSVDRSSVPLDLGAYGMVVRVGVPTSSGWAAAILYRSRTVISSSVSPSWLSEHEFDRKEPLRRRVRSYTSTPREPDTIAVPTPEALKDALSFIDLIPDAGRLPSVALADDGEINFYWRQDGLFIDIGFVGDGKMHYYVCVDADAVDVDASVDFTGRSLPRDVSAAMPRLARQRG